MVDDMEDEDRRRGRHRHRRRVRRHRAREPEVAESELGPESASSAESELSSEERAYRLARARADEKVKVTEGVLKLGAIAFVLAILKLGWVALIVLVVGGAKLSRKFYELVLEPKLRQRFVREEIEKQVQAGLSQERQLLEGAHARSMEQLSASIAHEIRNPITAAKSLVQQMGEDPAASDNVGYAKVALDELDRVERSISHLLRFARDEEIRITSIELSDVVDSALETFRDRLERIAVDVRREIDTDRAMRGDREKLRRVLINLLGNALDALEESDTEHPTIEITAGENLAGTEDWIRIRDNGPGMDPESLHKIFSPFYTSKANGTGLGLAISKKVVDAHGGSIEASSTPGEGTEFVLIFPKNPGETGNPT